MLDKTLLLGWPSLECQSCHIGAEKEDAAQAVLLKAEVKRLDEWMG